MNYNEAHHYLNFKIGGDNGLKMLMLLADDKTDEGINMEQVKQMGLLKKKRNMKYNNQFKISPNVLLVVQSI